MTRVAKIGVCSGILGAFLVALGLPLHANCVWLIGNPLLVYHNHKNHQKEQAFMFFIYTCIAIFGVYNLLIRYW